MLRFFRQIRQRLLTDNKFSKYLLYAVGEIFLVVIGILIALQVNNWNEARKRDKDRLELIDSLSQDFKNQIEILEARIKSDESTLKSLNNAIIMIETQNITIPIDSVKQHISRAFYSTGTFISFQKYEMAVNSGRIALIEDDNFDNNIAILLYTKSNLNRLREEYLNMNYSGPLSEIKKQYWEVYKPFEVSSNGISQDDKNYLNYISQADVMATVKMASVLKQNIIESMNRMLDAAKNIVHNLESQNK
jgi:hypothetical protein